MEVENLAFDPQKAEEIREKVLNDDTIDEREKEQLVVDLAKEYVGLGKVDEISRLLNDLEPFFNAIPKARGAKIIRKLIDSVGSEDVGEPGSFEKDPKELELQVLLCKAALEFAEKHKRMHIKQKIQYRLASLYFEQKRFLESLDLATELLMEVKRLDDKNLLIEVSLLLSRIFLSLNNMGRSKAALTTARTTAAAVYVPPLTQANLDYQSGLLFVAERDFKTAYSYLYEAFDNWAASDHRMTTIALQFMLLCKIMLSSFGEIEGILNAKNRTKYKDYPHIWSIVQIAKAAENGEVHEFREVLARNAKHIASKVLGQRLEELEKDLVEQHLLKILRPYSKIELSKLARLSKLPEDFVLTKITQLVLDKKISGIVDQGAGALSIFDDVQDTEAYEKAIEVLQKMNGVVDSLFIKAATLG